MLYSVQYSSCTEGHSWAPVHLLATHCPLGSTEAAELRLLETSPQLASHQSALTRDTEQGWSLDLVLISYRALLSTRSGDSVGVGEQRGLTTPVWTLSL